jgi:hypothetical protein
MMYPLVRDLAAAGAPVRVPVAVTCRVLNLARQPYYRWLANPIMSSELEEAYRANALFDAHRDDPEFGYRFLVDEACDAGEPMAPRTAWRICSDNGWWSAFGKPKRGKAGKPGPPVHDDLLAVVDEKGRVRHEFTGDGPNEVWLTDLTEHRTDEGKLYLCAIKDVYSNRIVGYAIDSSHLLAEIQAACDSIVMIDHGGVVFSGPMADLLARNSPTIRAAAENATDTARLIELVAAAGYPSTRVNGAIEIVAPAHWAADLNRLAWQAGITLGELQ